MRSSAWVLNFAPCISGSFHSCSAARQFFPGSLTPICAAMLIFLTRWGKGKKPTIKAHCEILMRRSRAHRALRQGLQSLKETLQAAVGLGQEFSESNLVPHPTPGVGRSEFPASCTLGAPARIMMLRRAL